MPPMAPARKGGSVRRQSGFTVGQGLLGLAIGGVSLAASILALRGADADQAETVHFAAQVLPGALSEAYARSGNSFGSSIPPVSGIYAAGEPGTLESQPASSSSSLAGNLARSHGWPAKLASGDGWSLAAGPNPAREVVLFLGCARGSGAALARCADLAEDLRRLSVAALTAEVSVDTSSPGDEFVRVLFHHHTAR